MRRRYALVFVSFCALFISSVASADTFGTGDNQFTIGFVDISGDASSYNGTNISQFSPGESGYKTFTDPENDYRMGTYEITNDQWNKFEAAYGTVTGSPSTAYGEDPFFTGTEVPTNEVSWLEAAQFINWLNTSTGHSVAYKFTGTQHTSDYSLDVWRPGDIGYDADNRYRNSNAYYFLPTEDEWVKAAYWNGTTLQTYATLDDTLPIEDVEANYYWGSGSQPWDVGSGSEELNGTYDMMGNVWEWMESPYYPGDYLSGSVRGNRGGSYYHEASYISLPSRGGSSPNFGGNVLGFRVASIPEPCSLVFLSLGGLALLRIKRCSFRSNLR